MAAIVKTKTTNGYGEKIQVTVVTVDKEKSRVECATRDGAMIFVAVWETGTIFRWPEVGEKWTVRKDMGVWRLGEIVQTELAEVESPHVPKTLEQLPEGETRILGETVHTGNVNAGDVESSGQITALNQSLITHVDVTPTEKLTAGGGSYHYEGEGISVVGSSQVTFDGVQPQVGQRIFVTKQANTYENGIYDVERFDITTSLFSSTAEAFAAQPIYATLQSTESFQKQGFNEMEPYTLEGSAPSASGYSPPSFEAGVGGIQTLNRITPGNNGVLASMTILHNSYAGTANRLMGMYINKEPSVLTGYRFTTLMTSETTYNFYIQRIENGAIGTTGKFEVNIPGYTVTHPFTMSVYSGANGVWGYYNNTAILHLEDTTFVNKEGVMGIEAQGSNPLITNFKASPAPTNGAVPYRSTYDLKRTEDETRPNQVVVAEEGTTLKSVQFPIKSTESGGESALDLETWHEIFLTSNWIWYTTHVFAKPAYRKSADGRVQLRGLLQPLVAGQHLIGTLPEGFRPQLQQGFACAGSYSSANTFVRVDVNPAGEILPEASMAAASTANYLFLDTISFYIY